MNAKDFLKNFFARGAVIYTLISVLFILGIYLTSDNSQEQVVLLKLPLYIALYSYILALGSTLYVSGYFSATISRLIHAICYNVGFFVILLLAGMQFSAAVICTLIFAIIYTLATIIITIVTKKAKKQSTPDKPKKIKTEKKQTAKSEEKIYKNRFS